MRNTENDHGRTLNDYKLRFGAGKRCQGLQPCDLCQMLSAAARAQWFRTMVRSWRFPRSNMGSQAGKFWLWSLKLIQAFALRFYKAVPTPSRSVIWFWSTLLPDNPHPLYKIPWNLDLHALWNYRNFQPSFLTSRTLRFVQAPPENCFVRCFKTTCLPKLSLKPNNKNHCRREFSIQVATKHISQAH